jgi:hypothetical protein
MARKAVVSYALGDDPAAKRRHLREGLRDVAAELLGLGEPAEEVVAALEQAANDVEAADLL